MELFFWKIRNNKSASPGLHIVAAVIMMPGYISAYTQLQDSGGLFWHIALEENFKEQERAL